MPIINRGYTSTHPGDDVRYENVTIPIIKTPVKLLFAGKTFGYNTAGERFDDWAVIYLTDENEVWWWFHLQPDSLPSSLNQMVSRGFVARHVINHPEWGTHTHVGRAKIPAGKSFESVGHAERAGWTLDPVEYILPSMNLPEHWGIYIQQKPQGAVDPYAGRPKADWDLKRDLNEVVLKTGATDNDRKRIVKEGLDFKQELYNSLHDPRFLDWYLQDPWVQEELNRRGITGENAKFEKVYTDLKTLVLKYEK